MSRRQMLGLAGSAAAVAALAGCAPGQSGARPSTGAARASAGATGGAVARAVPSCVLAAEATEGPYYVEDIKVREDVTEGRAGVPLRLRTRVVHATECTPIENAAVDIWHCDAHGYYSGFAGLDPDGDGEARDQSTATTFMRGVQLTDGEGVAGFDTVYPGWYVGRALHIHVKVLVGGAVEGETYDGGHIAHTGQLYFPEETTDEVAGIEPYASRTVDRTRQEDDFIFLDGGEDSIVELTPLNEGSVGDGYVAEIVLGVDPEAAPSA